MNTFYGWNKGKVGFPGGPVVNLPPVLRMWFGPWSRKNPHGAGQLTPCATTTEHSVQSTYCTVRKGTAVEARTGAERRAPTTQPEKACTQQ